MTKIFCWTAVAVAAVACTRETREDDWVDVTLEASHPEIGTAVRTFMDGTTPMWSAEDGIGIYDLEGGHLYGFKTGAAAETAVFTGRMEASSLGRTLYSVYPYDAEGTCAAAVAVTVPAEQHPVAGSFDGKADVLVSAPFVAEDATSVAAVSFKRLTAVVKVVLKDAEGLLSGDKVASLALSVSSSDASKVYRLAGTRSIGLAAGEWAAWEDGAEAASRVDAEISDGIPFGETGAAVYLSVMPEVIAKADATMTVTASTVAGKVISIPLVLGEAAALTKDIVLAPATVTTLTFNVRSAHVCRLAFTETGALTLAPFRTVTVGVDANVGWELVPEDSAADLLQVDKGDGQATITAHAPFGNGTYTLTLRAVGVEGVPAVTRTIKVTPIQSIPASLDANTSATLNGDGTVTLRIDGPKTEGGAYGRPYIKESTKRKLGRFGWKFSDVHLEDGTYIHLRAMPATCKWDGNDVAVQVSIKPGEVTISATGKLSTWDGKYFAAWAAGGKKWTYTAGVPSSLSEIDEVYFIFGKRSDESLAFFRLFINGTTDTELVVDNWDGSLKNPWSSANNIGGAAHVDGLLWETAITGGSGSLKVESYNYNEDVWPTL